MTIHIVKVGKLTALTKGPPAGLYYELRADGIHCNPMVMGPYIPTNLPPAPPGYCLV